mgnify:FL=1
MTQKQKILLAFVLPALVSLLAISLFLEQSHRQLAIERWAVEHKSHVRTISQALQGEIDEAQSHLTLVGQLAEFSRLNAVDRIDRELNGIPPDTEAGKRQILDALIARLPSLSTLFVLLPNGDHYISHPFTVQQSLKKYNLADRGYFKAATETRKPAVSDSIIGADGKLAVVVDIPLLDSHGEIYAHLGGVVLLQNLSNLLSADRITPFDLGILTDRQGKLIAHSDPTQIGPESPLFKHDHPLLATPQTTQQDVAFLRWKDASGVEWLSFTDQLESGWNLLLQRRLSGVADAYAGAVRQTVIVISLILLMTGGIGLTMAVVVARRWEAADRALAQSRDKLEQRVAERTAELASSQAQVAESRDFYLSVLESFPSLIWRAGLDAKCDYFNRTWLEFTGRTLAQELGDGWAEGVHPDELKPCVETYLSAFGKREPFAMEYRLRRHDGVYRWILDIGRPFHDINGEFIGYLGVCFDVS